MRRTHQTESVIAARAHVLAIECALFYCDPDDYRCGGKTSANKVVTSPACHVGIIRDSTRLDLLGLQDRAVPLGRGAAWHLLRRMKVYEERYLSQRA